MTPPLFSPAARIQQRTRALRQTDRWITDRMVDEVLYRLDEAHDTPGNALVLGAEPRLLEGLTWRGWRQTVIEPAPSPARQARALCADEAAHDQVDARHDLVLSAGGLDTVNDLPGALLLARRALKPGGRLIASLIGGPSLPALRAACLAADALCGEARRHVHPQVEVRTAGDLMIRAGFVRVITDIDRLTVRYAQLRRLVDDLRAAGATNALQQRKAVSRSWWATASQAFARAGDQGRTEERLTLITMVGQNPRQPMCRSD